MSWETISTKKIKCPCGKGFIEQETKGDDWNRYEDEIPVILCEDCSKKYKIESKYFCPKPKHDYTIYYCVNKDNENEKIKLDL